MYHLSRQARRLRKTTFTGIATVALALVAGSCLIMPGAAAASPHSCARAAQPPEQPGGGQLSGVVVISQCDAWAVGFWSPGPPSETDAMAMLWNGRTWHSTTVPIPAGGTNSELQGVSAVSPHNVWAVGSYVPSGSGSATLVEHWNGTAWSQISSANPACSGCDTAEGSLSAVAAHSAKDIWAIGGSLIEHWNGTAWSIVPSHGNWRLSGVTAISAKDAWAVGYYIAPYGCCSRARTLTVHWNGNAWRRVRSPDAAGPGLNSNSLNSVSAAAAGNIWAVGYYSDAKEEKVLTLAEHWNGHAWKIIASPNPSSSIYSDELHGVTTESPSNAWATGEKVNGDTGAEKTLILHWNGRAWRPVPSGNPGASYVSEHLMAIAGTSCSNLWAVGYYQRSALSSRPTTVRC
jgi:hypothetical protein